MLAGEDLWWSVTQIPIWSRNIASRANKESCYKAEMIPASVFNYVCSFTAHNKAGFCVTGETTAQEQSAAVQGLAGKELWAENSGAPWLEGGLHLKGGL